MQLGRFGTVLRIDPSHVVRVWWGGKFLDDLITFDDAGFKLMFDVFSMNQQRQSDVALGEIKQFLNNVLIADKYDFDKQGPIRLDERGVRALLGMKE